MSWSAEISTYHQKRGHMFLEHSVVLVFLNSDSLRGIAARCAAVCRLLNSKIR